MVSDSLQMVDIQTQYEQIKTDIDRAVMGVMHKGQFINGPEVKLFSEELAEYLGVKHVIPCASGTDALQLALMALNLRPGDEVITTSFSFFATIEVIVLLGLVPVFSDIDPSTYNLDSVSVESLITPRTRCIIPVHLFGQGANMEEIMRIALENNLFVIEDVAQSLGSALRLNGETRKLGTIGDIGCTSFFPTKNLGCFGDGGAVMTNDSRLAGRVALLANHGSKKQYIHEAIGVNSRLDTIQAAILRVKLPFLDGYIKMRQDIAASYIFGFEKLSEIINPGCQANAVHSFNQFTVRIMKNRRDALQKYLQSRAIPSRIYYPVPLHLQVAMKEVMDGQCNCPNAQQLCTEVLSLPIYPGMDIRNTEPIIQAIASFFNK